jgi:uncharacterized membrane protein
LDTWTLTVDPAWPWSLRTWGAPALLLVALLLTVLTVWTYRGVPGVSRRRIGVVLGLRLAALLLAVLAVARPSVASRESLKTPSTLVFLLDASESMTIQDEYGNYSRWEVLRRTLDKCGPVLDQLRDEQNVTVRFHRFAEGVGDDDPQGKADGKRTDFGTALHDLAATYAQERALRGLVILSDGADNGGAYVAATEAEKWRRNCPITTFALGKKTTSSQQRDIRMVSIVPEPSPVAVKGKLAVRVLIDAPGFEGQTVPVHLLVEEPGREPKEVVVQDEKLTKTLGNEIRLFTTAPATPGEIKLTVRVDPQSREAFRTNNEISTYVTVTKEGLSILYVEGKVRAWEPQAIRRALDDPRIRLTEHVRPTDTRYTPAEADLFNFEKQHYDVLIVGDITARRLSGGDPKILTTIRDLVAKQGMGVLFLGGFESYGNSDWRDQKDLADLLPVDLAERGQVEAAIRMAPTEKGLHDYVFMRLADNEQDSLNLWSKLPKLQDMTRLGGLKAGAKVLARADNATAGKPLLVAQDFGKGRTLAFAADTTWLWRNLGLDQHPPVPEGVLLHNRFWKQMALYLAHQEENGDEVWVNLDTRRLAAGGKLGFSVGARGKTGAELTKARFEVSVTPPQGGSSAVLVSRDRDGNRGSYTKTETPGEYRLTARAFVPKAGGGEETVGADKTVRFTVYQDTAEMSRPAADPDFLERLARAGGGKAYRAEDLPRFLQDLKGQPLRSTKPKTDLWPDWRRTKPSPFLMVFFLLFVGLIGLEWFLRRSWGMV